MLLSLVLVSLGAVMRRRVFMKVVAGYATLLVAAFLWLSSGLAQGAGSFADGNRIFSSCSGTDGMELSYCAGYVAGMADALAATGHACMPPDATVQQAVDAVVKYLREHSDQRQYPAWYVGRTALSLRFPCN